MEVLRAFAIASNAIDRIVYDGEITPDIFISELLTVYADDIIELEEKKSKIDY